MKKREYTMIASDTPAIFQAMLKEISSNGWLVEYFTATPVRGGFQYHAIIYREV